MNILCFVLGVCIGKLLINYKDRKLVRNERIYRKDDW